MFSVQSSDTPKSESNRTGTSEIPEIESQSQPVKIDRNNTREWAISLLQN